MSLRGLVGGAALDADRVRIEPMRRRHLRAIMPIESDAYPVSWSRRIFESELDQADAGHRLYVVARVGRQVVGYAGLLFVPDPDGEQAHITNIVVAPDHRRRGIATSLLLHLAERARRRGCVAWTLEVRASSTGAQELYRRFGFAPVGVRARYYDNVEDAVVMWCHHMDGDEYGQRLEELACHASTNH